MAYARLLSRLLNTPLAISQDKLDVITSNVSLRLLSGEHIPALEADDSMFFPTQNQSEETTPTIGVINVFDSLVTRNGAGSSGSTSYESIQRNIDYALKNKVTHLVFKIGSPGGEVEGLFELAQTINSIPATHGIETIAVATGNMTSAAYVIGAACQKVYSTSASIVGSIGVIMTLINTTEADKKQGYSYTILRSKDEKALINPHEKFSQKAIDNAITMLEQFDSIMNQAVNTFRPSLSIEKIIDLKGNTVLGEEAVSIGLTDGIVSSFQEVISGITAKSSLKQPQQGATMAATTETISATDEIAALRAQLADAQNLIASSADQARTAEQTRFSSILSGANILGIPNATAVAQKYYMAGMSAVDAIANMTILKETIQLANPSPSTQGLVGSITENVLGAVEEEDYITSLVTKMSARTGKAFDCSEDASEFEAADVLLHFVN